MENFEKIGKFLRVGQRRHPYEDLIKYEVRRKTGSQKWQIVVYFQKAGTNERHTCAVSFESEDEATEKAQEFDQLVKSFENDRF